jgi:hypothetical protein
MGFRLNIYEQRRNKKNTNHMKKILNKVRQWRLVGYITIGVGMAQGGFEPQTIVIDMFLLVLLTELGARGVKVSTPQEFKTEIKSSSNPTDSLRGTSNKKNSAPRTSKDKLSRTRVTPRTTTLLDDVTQEEIISQLNEGRD